MFAAFWGGGAGSEVLSTEEMRSKHPRTSLKPQGGKAGFSFSRTVGPGLGKQKVQPRVGEKGKRHYLHHLAEKGESLPRTQGKSRAEDVPTLGKWREQNH